MKNAKNDRSISAVISEKHVYSLIGLAKRAGFVQSGEFLTEQTVKEGKAKFVIVSADASNNTKKMFGNMCKYYQVPYAVFGTKDELGHAIGKEFRASLALTNQGFTEKISDYINKLSAKEAKDIRVGVEER